MNIASKTFAPMETVSESQLERLPVRELTQDELLAVTESMLICCRNSMVIYLATGDHASIKKMLKKRIKNKQTSIAIDEWVKANNAQFDRHLGKYVVMA
jgi:hypothetical protein